MDSYLHNELILIVDDNEDQLFFMQESLKCFNYDVVQATNKSDALTIIRERKIDLVITDVEMPGGSGIDLLRAIKKSRPLLPVIIQTGKPKIEAAVECIKLGAHDYLSKPFSPPKMMQVVVDVLRLVKKLREQTAGKTVKTVKIDEKGDFLGGYRIIHKLGEGASGIVYLAKKKMGENSNEYAIKVLKKGHISNKASIYRKRFIKEAEAASQINHRNIVGIEEFGLDEKEMTPYIVMEYFPGRTLKDYILKREKLNYRQKVSIILQIGEALVAIHKHRIVHRDIKPANIIINKDHNAKLTDFGIARLPNSNLTLTSSILGTPSYLSPEGVVSAKVDYRADIFSFGVVAYEFFLREKPFKSSKFLSLMREIQTKKPIEPQKIMSDFPPVLQIILAKMLKKKVTDRYQNAESIVSDIKAFMNTDNDGTAPHLKDQEQKNDWT